MITKYRNWTDKELNKENSNSNTIQFQDAKHEQDYHWNKKQDNFHIHLMRWH